jgi:2,4-dienoyl-CoA reductase-like NADH-dependent reductase (Old Yellow Enzyme family)
MPYVPLSVPVREMGLDDIEAVVEAFAQCTRNAAAAGYDGVELHASHSYLVEEFLSPFYNKRTDEYGGSVENRMRFMLECLGAMRGAAERSIAVGVRLNCDERLPGGLTTADMRVIAAAVDDSRLVDFIDLDLGTYHNYEYLIGPTQTGEHWQVPAIAEVRSAIRRAAVLGCPGLFHDPAKAEDLVASGVMDMVGGTRGFFAEPELARKAQEGHPERIRPCIGLNMCVGGSGCVMNPANGLEFQFGVTKMRRTSTPRRAVIVGGGPAGLEAARNGIPPWT